MTSEEPTAPQPQEDHPALGGDLGMWALVLLGLSSFCGGAGFLAVPVGLYAWWKTREVRDVPLSPADQLRLKMNRIAGIVSALYGVIMLLIMVWVMLFFSVVGFGVLAGLQALGEEEIEAAVEEFIEELDSEEEPSEHDDEAPTEPD